MKPCPLLFVFALLCGSIADGQTRPSVETLRALLGEPLEKSSVPNAPARRVLEISEKAVLAASSMDAQRLANMGGNDPLLKEIYAYRLGWIDDNNEPWALIIDDDLKMRKEARTIVKSLFAADAFLNVRFNILWWIDKHRDVEWGDELMEDAIRIYRADPTKWTFSDVAILSRLVAAIGNESHLPFFDELDKTEIGSGEDRGYLVHRLSLAKHQPSLSPKANGVKMAISDSEDGQLPAAGKGGTEKQNQIKEADTKLHPAYLILPLIVIVLMTWKFVHKR